MVRQYLRSYSRYHSADAVCILDSSSVEQGYELYRFEKTEDEIVARYRVKSVETGKSSPSSGTCCCKKVKFEGANAREGSVSSSVAYCRGSSLSVLGSLASTPVAAGKMRHRRNDSVVVSVKMESAYSDPHDDWKNQECPAAATAAAAAAPQPGADYVDVEDCCSTKSSELEKSVISLPMLIGRILGLKRAREAEVVATAAAASMPSVAESEEYDGDVSCDAEREDAEAEVVAADALEAAGGRLTMAGGGGGADGGAAAGGADQETAF